MRTRTFGRWGLLSLSCLALLTFWTQSGRPQPAPGSVPPAVSDDKAQAPSAPVPPIPIPPPDLKPPIAPPVPVPTPAPTVEDLIKQLEQLRKQRADLEAQEKAVAAKLQERLKDQADRLNKLGILPQAPPPPPESKDAVDGITPLLKK